MGLLDFIKKCLGIKSPTKHRFDADITDAFIQGKQEPIYDLSEDVKRIAADVREIMDTQLPSEIIPANNWLKMHGIPMQRRCGRRKRNGS